MRLLLPPLVLVVMLSMFVGCVEVKDETEPLSHANPVAEEQRLPAAETEFVEPLDPDLLVDQPLYLLKGDVLTEAQFRALPSEMAVLPEKEIYEYHFNEMSFTRDGVLYTLGATVRIHANSLNSQSGEIATFPLNSVAPAQRPGRSGGHVIVKAGQASGLLKISLRGEKGGDGAPGPEPTEALKGDPGDPAKQTNCFIEGDYQNKIGGPGKPGKKGFRGLSGGHGGNSGALDFDVSSGVEFSPRITKEPGKGGNPGRGGAGGVQGDIGPSPCVALFPSTYERPRGEPGEDGPPAPEGIEEDAWVKIEGQRYLL